MDNNFNTGKPYLDLIALGVAWIGAFIRWETTPVLLSCVASMFVIVKAALELWDRKNRNKK